MNPRTFRLVVAFLGAFIALSLLPTLPATIRAFQTLPAIELPAITQMGDILLGITALLLAVLLTISVRRRHRANRGHGFERALQAAHHAMVQPAARMNHQAPRERVATRGAATPGRPDSELQGKIRQAARKGERAPALARRHSLSVDAIRLAIGEPLPAPAVRRGRTFRPRQPSLPASQPARALPGQRTPYGALA